MGTLAVTQSILPLVQASATGRIVNVSSAAASLTLNFDPAFPCRPYFGATYAASKTALNAMTLALAIEFEDTPIKVRAVSHSFAATAINDFMGSRSTVIQQKTGRPVQFEIMTEAHKSLDAWLQRRGDRNGCY